MTRTVRSRSLRLRLTVLATLAITVTVALTAAVLVFTLVSSVRTNVNTTLSAYADSIARSAPDGRWPQPLPSAPGDPGVWAQVVDSSGTVLAATANIAGQPALYTLPAGSTTPHPSPNATGDRGDERVVAQRYVVGTTPVVVYAGGSTQLLGILTNDIQGHLLYLLPLVLLGAVAISWVLIGRTLRPVERIRAEAAEITGSDLHRRIPEPDSDDEIGRLARTLNTMLDRLQDSSTRQRALVADASHELRTPLAAIRTSLEVGLAHRDRAPGRSSRNAPSPRPPGCNGWSTHSCCWPGRTTTRCSATVSTSISATWPAPRSPPRRPAFRSRSTPNPACGCWATPTSSPG